MSIIKTYNSPLLKKLNIEFYNSANEMASDLETRQITSNRFDSNPYSDRKFAGATREQTYEMLRNGYQPTVDAMKDKTKFSTTGKRFKSFNDVVGFAPIVPNAIMGLPNSMVNSSMAPIKTKVLDIYYDMTLSAYVDSGDDLIKAGQKMLGVILEMEAQGYRFNLYVCQTYADSQSCDMVCVKVKSANQPFDLKRMSFPVSHTAFFRGIGFDWYSKFPLGTYRCGYGTPLYHTKTQDEIKAEFKRLFGKGATYFSAQTLVKDKKNAENYIKGVLTNDQK